MMIEKVDKDELTGVAIKIDCLEYIIQNLTEDYFDKYNAGKRQDIYAIVHGFPRYRAMANIVCDYILDIRNTLKALDIPCNGS